jgi:dihydrofolate reductase
MKKLVVSEFVSLDGVMQAPGGKDEDTEGGFRHGAWTLPYWNAFEKLPAGDFFGDMMNAPKKYVVSKTLEKPIWRNTTIIRDDVAGEVRRLKAAAGKDIITDGSHELVHELLRHDLVDELHLLVYPLILGEGKRLFPEGVHTPFVLKHTTPYPSGVVGLHYERVL